MKNNLFKQAALLVAAVLLTTNFWSCSKDEDSEPTPPIVSVTGVTLNKTSISIQVGGTETLTATVSPKDAANKKVTWKSDKPEIATVDANGKVTGVKVGSATVTVTTEEGGKTATCKITVSDKEIKVTEVKLNKSETSILVGGNETLTATVLPENATNQKVTWQSDKTEVATVDASGKVTGVKVGEATITVTTEDGGKTATCKVTVKAATVAVTGVTLNKTETTILVGGSETLTATVAPEDATNQKVTWQSDKPEIATVDASGKVTGVAAGEATITVTTVDGGKTATCKVTVEAATIAVTGVTLNKTELTLEVDGSETLTATVAPDDATNQNVTWKSDNPEIVTVDANGKVTGVAIGEATITVTTEDGGKTATCKVAVKVPDIEGVVWFDEELAKTDIPEAMVFKDGTLLYYQYAKNDKAVSILKKETGKETIKKGDLVHKYTYSYTIVKNADGTSGTILSTGITMEYSKLTMNSVLMVVNGKNTLQCYTAEYLGFPINGVLK